MEWVFDWRVDDRPWTRGEACYVGKWRVGKVDWTSRIKGELEHEGAFMFLPGLKSCLGHYATKDEAKLRVERAAAGWLNGLSAPIA